jgi:hypothetical protein
MSMLGVESETWTYPDWYPMFVAGDILHCPPWEVLEHSVYWRDKAHIKQTAEQQAREIIKARNGNA